MSQTVFIDGQAGTTGLGIAARLRDVPGITLRTIADRERKSPIARQAAMRDAARVILGLPDEAARAAVALATALGEAAPKLLDASSAHRIAPGWTYGFAELDPGQPARIAAATRVANPGCYATGAIALLHPLISAGLLAADTRLSINAVSGYSGGGNTMIAAHEHTGGPAFELYGLGLDHKHLPEVVVQSGLIRTPIFVPSVAHLRQGMLVSIPLFLDDLTPAHLHDCLSAFYADAEQVRVIPSDDTARLRIDTLNDTDLMELSVHADKTGRQAVLVARLDNLGKGASGAAVQNTRLMLGISP
jgi:N-acetyl-gamma-glutamyl-phosphate reductase